MFQPVGIPAGSKVTSSGKSVPRYFVDEFFLPWCRNAHLKQGYDSNALIEAINTEIKRLDMLKLGNKKNRSKSRHASIASSEVKCVAKGCRYAGINTSNKTAVGVCVRCGSFEHFDCSKTKAEDREEILKGIQQYTCTVCFIKNPSQVTFDPKGRFSKKTDTITHTQEAIEGPAEYSSNVEEVQKCTFCSFSSKDKK